MNERQTYLDEEQTDYKQIKLYLFIYSFNWFCYYYFIIIIKVSNYIKWKYVS